MRSKAITRNAPTPTATAPTRTALGTLGTCSASTWRSGSDTVMITPIRKLTDTTTHSFRDLVIWAPTRSPMGVMAVSAPSVNSPMPTISSTAPIKNASRMSVGTGAIVKHSSSTMAVMGSTDASASRTFSPRMVLFCPMFSFHRFRKPPRISSPRFLQNAHFLHDSMQILSPSTLPGNLQNL